MKEVDKQYNMLLHEYNEVAKNGLNCRVFKAISFGAAWTSLLIFSLMMSLLPVSRLYFTARIHEFRAVQSTIELGRINHMDDMELRGVISQISAWNGWLAFWQTLNKVPVLDFYIPDGIALVEPMK